MIFLDALQCKNNQCRPPIWLMRQAGRYMPEYRALRAKYSFLELCHNPELVTQVTELPIHTFGFDAAILFSDILVILESFGIEFDFHEGKGPIIKNPLQSENELHFQSIDCLNYVKVSIENLKRSLKIPLLGFCGAPFTVASYLIEGGVSKDLKKTKQWMLQRPESFHLLLSKLCNASIAYLKMQQQAGVDAIQIFDSWAHVLSDHHFQEFSLPYLKKMKEALTPFPVILFCKGSSAFVNHLASIKPQAISLDWQSNLQAIRQKTPPTIALQGNLDPDILYAPLKDIKKEALRLLKSMQGDKGYIFNLGHGIHPDTPLDAVKTLVQTVKEFS